MFTEVKDTGKEHTAFTTGSKRDNRVGKGRFDLLSPIVLKRDAVHMENGARKYEDRNWEKGQPLGTFFDSAIRHLYAYLEGDRSEDHLAAARWNIGGIIHCEEMIARGELPAELDNLPSYKRRGCERIYVAGPFSAPTKHEQDDNIFTAVSIATELMRMGHQAHCPHAATAPIEALDRREKISYEDYMALDFGIIEHWATALYYIGPSPGTDRELARAQELGLKVYRSLEEVPCLATSKTSSSDQTKTTKTPTTPTNATSRSCGCLVLGPPT